MKFALALFFLCSLPNFGHAAAGGNDFFAELFAPGMNQGSRAKLEQRVYARQFAGGSPFGLSQTRFETSVPVSGDPDNSWRANAFAEYDGIDSAAAFSNGRRMPNRLWDTGAGFSHSRLLEEGRTAGGSFTINSPSDRPFSAGRDLGFNLNLTYKIPQPDGNAWILFLSASNTRGFINYVPLPGAAYYFKTGKNLRGLVGVPFLLLLWQPADPWIVTTFYFPLRSGEIRVSYGRPFGFQPYGLVNFRTRNYRLFDRAAEKERLFSEEAVAQLGLNFPIAKGLLCDVSGGTSFARRYFLAEKATDRQDTPRIAPDNALFAQAKVSANF